MRQIMFGFGRTGAIVFSICILVGLFRPAKAIGQDSGVTDIQMLAGFVPAEERFAFAQQLLNGALKGIDLERSDDAEALDRIADSWTRWVCLSPDESRGRKAWLEFVSMSNQVSVERLKVPLLIDEGHYPRLTAMVFPLEVNEVRHFEFDYEKWRNNRGDLTAWNAVRNRFSEVNQKYWNAEFPAELSTKVDAIYKDESGRSWNTLAYFGDQFDLENQFFETYQEKEQFDIGVKRVLMAMNLENSTEHSGALELGRGYLRCQASNNADWWKSLSDLLSSLVAEKHLQSVVTFVTQDAKKNLTTDATVAYRVIAQSSVSRTKQQTVKIDSGVYEVWSERDDHPTSDRVSHRILSEVMEVPIFEKK